MIQDRAVCGVEEKHVSSREIETVIASDRRHEISPLEVSPKAKEPNHLNIMDVVAHRALSPLLPPPLLSLSAASGASRTAEGMKSDHAGAHLPSQVLT